MDKETRRMRQRLGYDDGLEKEEEGEFKERQEFLVPAWVFFALASVSFFVGIAGIYFTTGNEKWLIFFGSFIVAWPVALIIYPIVRAIMGPGRTVASMIISAILGKWVESQFMGMVKKEKNKRKH